MRREFETSASPPAPSSTKDSFTGTPPIPPFLLISSAIISAAAFPGTPNTEAGPDRKVVMPILISVGLPCASTGPARIAVVMPAASTVFRNCIENLPGFHLNLHAAWRPSCGGFCLRSSALQAVVILRHYGGRSDQVNGLLRSLSSCEANAVALRPPWQTAG